MEIKEFLGKKYVLVKHENLEEYLKYLGKGLFARKAALAMRPEVWLTAEDDVYTIHFSSSLVSSTVTFTPGVEFDEVKPDGVKVKSVVTIEDNKMTHVQTEDNGRISTHVREFYPDKLIITTTAKGLDKVVVRHHELVQ